MWSQDDSVPTVYENHLWTSGKIGVWAFSAVVDCFSKGERLLCWWALDQDVLKIFNGQCGTRLSKLCRPSVQFEYQHCLGLKFPVKEEKEQELGGWIWGSLKERSFPEHEKGKKERVPWDEKVWVSRVRGRGREVNHRVGRRTWIQKADSGMLPKWVDLAEFYH